MFGIFKKVKETREKMAEMGNLVTAEECDAMDAKCDERIKAAKEFAMASPYPDESEYLRYVYEE